MKFYKLQISKKKKVLQAVTLIKKFNRREEPNTALGF